MKSRRKLFVNIANDQDVIAVGETVLDYNDINEGPP